MTNHSKREPWRWVLPTVFFLGALLRLIWPADMEFKYDELFMFDRTQKIGVTEGWPWLGMTSGAGYRNPGLSIWIFALFAKMFFVKTEIGLVRIVMFLNTAALGLMMMVAYRFLPWFYEDSKTAEKDRPTWLWASVLLAVNPLAMLFERKIWAQSILPLFSLLFLLSWFKRRDRWGAFFWGFLGACLGQIHMSGFFFAGGFLLWTFFNFDKKKPNENTHWRYWIAGTSLGALLISPWIYYMLREIFHHLTGAGATGSLPQKTFTLHFFKFWIEDAIGVENPFYFENPPFGVNHPGSGISFSLGPFIEAFWGDYYFANFSRWLILATSLLVYLKSLWPLIRSPEKAKEILKPHSPTSQATLATLLGMGVVISAFPIPVFRHYLIVAYPLQWLFLVKLVIKNFKKHQRVLLAIFFANLVLSVHLLYFLHINGGAPGGDYGPSFRVSQTLRR